MLQMRPHPCHKIMCVRVKERAKNHSIRLIFEPGRALIANAGILLTRVEYIKETDENTFRYR